jgi:hypothetical protein
MKRNAKVTLAVLLCLVPFAALGCRSAAITKWTIEDAGWNDKYSDAHCVSKMSLALDSKGIPQILYELEYPYSGADLVLPTPTMFHIRWAWQDTSAVPSLWKSQELHEAWMNVGEESFRLHLTKNDDPVCASRCQLSRVQTKVKTGTDADRVEWVSMPMPTLPQIFDFALDPQGNCLFVWFGDIYHREAPVLLFARQDGNEWKTETIDSTLPQSAYPDIRSRIEADAAGGIHVVYCTPKEIRYAFRDTTGWRLETIAADVAGPAELGIAMDNSRGPHVVYEDGKEGIMYAWQDAQGWHREQVGVGRGPSIDVDKFSGMPYVAFIQANNPDVGGDDWRVILTCRVDGKWLDKTINTKAAMGSSTDVKLHYNGTAPVSIGVAFQSSVDNNNVKFASAQFAKGKAILAIFGSLASLALCCALCVARRNSGVRGGA